MTSIYMIESQELEYTLIVVRFDEEEKKMNERVAFIDKETSSEYTGWIRKKTFFPFWKSKFK